MRKHKIINLSVGGLAMLILLALLCPSVGTANAEDMTAIEETTTKARVWVRPSLSIALAPTIDVDVVPKSTGTFGSNSIDLSVSTNSRNGFKVLLSAVDGTALKSTEPSNFSLIESVSQPVKPSDFTNNTWGYYIGTSEPATDATYHPIPSTSTEIESTDTSSVDQVYKLSFGAKISTSIPSGLYSNSVLVSVVANPIEAVTLQDLYYLQDMTPEICTATSSIEVTKELIDARDGKSYKVAKLKDGSCWMEEDLKLSLSTEKALTPADSNIEENWIPNTTTATAATNNSGDTAQASWKIGGRWYYQQSAATAGWQRKTSTDNYTSSICPKGWTLPLSESTITGVGGSFLKLLNAYGIFTQYTATVTTAPLNFGLNGLVSEGKLDGVGQAGWFWSRLKGRDLWVSPTNGISAFDNAGTAIGFSVRCVAITSEV